MTSQDFIKTRYRSRQVVYHRPSRLNKTIFDSFYEDMSEDWQERAKRLRLRRWHKLKQKQLT